YSVRIGRDEIASTPFTQRLHGIDRPVFVNEYPSRPLELDFRKKKSTGIRIAFQYDFHPRLYGDRPSFDFAFATPGQGLASTYDRHTRQGQLFESRSKRALALEPSPKPVCSCTKALQVVHSAKDGERTRYRHYESAQRGDGSECARGHQQRTEVRAVEKRLDPEDKVQNQLTEKRKQENTHRARGPQPHR